MFNFFKKINQNSIVKAGTNIALNEVKDRVTEVKTVARFYIYGGLAVVALIVLILTLIIFKLFTL